MMVVILFVVIYSCLKTADLAWALGDLGVGLMAWLNIIGILFLQKPAFAALRDYEAQVKQGKDPIYDARANGVHNAPIWDEISAKYRKEFGEQPNHDRFVP